MSRPKSKPIYSRYLKPALRPTAEFFEHITNKCPEYIPAALRIIDSEGFMMVEPRVLLGPKGLNSIRPKVNIGSKGSILVGGQSIICLPRLYISPTVGILSKGIYDVRAKIIKGSELFGL